MSNKKSEKIKKDVTQQFIGHVVGLKVAAGLCEFQLKTKKHGTQLFTVDPKESGYFSIAITAFAGKHKITVQPAIENGSNGRIASINIGDVQKAPKLEKPAKAKKAEKAIPETVSA